VKGNNPSSIVSEARKMYPEINDFNIAEVLKRE
jgi:hypothetical protein